MDGETFFLGLVIATFVVFALTLAYGSAVAGGDDKKD